MQKCFMMFHVPVPGGEKHFYQAGTDVPKGLLGFVGLNAEGRSYGEFVFCVIPRMPQDILGKSKAASWIPLKFIS